MKRQTLAALITSAFVLAACNGQQQASQQPAAQGTQTTASSTPSAPDVAPQTAEADVPVDQLPVIDAVMTHAPEVPPPVNRDHAALVKVKMETIEKNHENG